jgi:hypothetical protein
VGLTVALVTNATRDSGNPLRLWGAAIAERPTYGKPGALRNLEVGEARTAGVSDRQGLPSGVRHPATWLMPSKPGAMAARNEIEASAAFVAAGALGRNLGADLSAAAVLSAAADLIVSAQAALTASATVSGNVIAALQGAAGLVASGQVAAAAQALGSLLASLDGSGVVSATPRARGVLAATLDTAAVGETTPGTVAAEILDAQIVEAGMTVRQALRLCAAALAGKVSGAEGATVTFRNAAADSKDRIVASVDANGNRTAVTLDLD